MTPLEETDVKPHDRRALAMDALWNPDLRYDQRIVLAMMILDSVEHGHQARTEPELAAMVSMSGPQVRQAIIGLRNHTMVRREWLTVATPGTLSDTKPEPARAAYILNDMVDWT